MQRDYQIIAVDFDGTLFYWRGGSGMFAVCGDFGYICGGLYDSFYYDIL